MEPSGTSASTSKQARYNRWYLESINGPMKRAAPPWVIWTWVGIGVMLLVLMLLSGCVRDPESGFMDYDRRLADSLCADMGGVYQYTYASAAVVVVTCRDRTHIRFEKE